MIKHFRVFKFISLSIFFALVCFSAIVQADDFYVSVDGDDANPGTRTQPWRSVANSTPRLNPGDRLLIFPGDYHETQTIFVRRSDPDTFEYLPIEGDADNVTVICAATRRRPKIYGHFDVRGGYVRLHSLVVIGDAESPEEGIGVFESHHVTVSNCYVANHGGGGIQFNQSDVSIAVNNVCVGNATTNPSQQSGISSFQPVVRTDTDERYGVIFRGNVCLRNRNEAPTEAGLITDGNGVILDDHAYTQFNDLLAGIVTKQIDPTQSSGVPVIETDEGGQLLPYARRSLVTRNICAANGGRGIQVFQTDDAVITRNLCYFNNRSQATIDNLPRDEDGRPFFTFGEITLQDSTNVVVARNVAFASSADSAAAAELFFDLAGESPTNRWYRNHLDNLHPGGPTVSVANNDDSDLLD